eukprot:TRINITY_DN5412_c0_g1_i1.p1 TRINITY_DN5412_c0_g1~~TRINITY_DN5412_c0_g1_i1.p1  ORF type:complete len:107 (-),score=4.98 TRINITY_DN5412_c0_g1_i1:563-883(-)
MSVSVIYCPWSFRAWIEEATFFLDAENRLNVDDVERHFMIVFVILYLDSEFASKEVISPSGETPYSRRRFKPGSTLYITGPRTPKGQLWEFYCACKKFWYSFVSDE